MINSEQLKQNVVKAAEEIRATNPMAGLHHQYGDD